MNSHTWSISIWRGEGWYAPYNYGEYTLYYWAGDNRQDAEEFASIGELGTPSYFDKEESG